ncbi:histone-fold-containing protein [Xylaria sp. FL0064]|nr:histone-fold-containing protein [Xylaria sp. FL0064]
MPPKKTDPARRGDVSMAQFVYDGDLDRAEPAFAVPLQPKPTAPATSIPAAQMEADGPADSSMLADKERDKEKEKKEKDKDSSKEAVTIEDLTLPKSIITRLAKGVLPSNTQIQANAILAMSKSATVFINHLANAANEHTQNNNKKTIMPGDVFAALEDIEFPFFRERLEAEFKKFNDTQTTKRNTYRRKVAAQKKAGAEKTGPDAADPNTSIISTASTAAESTSAPRSKKQKPNAAHEESAMDVDGDETQEPRDASDADTEPEQEQEEDDDDEEEQENAEEEEEEDDEEEKEEEIHDRLEERKPREDDEDEALDDDEDSD